MGEQQILPVQSALAGQSLEVAVALPAGYDPAQRYPVIYCDPGPVHFDRLQFPAWLDGEIGAGRLPACIAVHLPDPEIADYWIPGTAGMATYAAVVSQEVVPAVEANFACGPRLLLATSSLAVTTLEVALRCPGLFERAALQSPGWLVHEEGVIVSQLDRALAVFDHAPAGPLPAIWFVWGDSETDEWEAKSRPNGQRMMAALQERGATVTFSIVPGGHGLPLLRDTLAAAVAFLLT